jgi:hypothetical protein
MIADFDFNSPRFATLNELEKKIDRFARSVPGSLSAPLPPALAALGRPCPIIDALFRAPTDEEAAAAERFKRAHAEFKGTSI